MDISIKNDIATSISHTHVHNKPLIKTLHYMVYITSSEAKLFAIRCRINQASNLSDILKIIVITNSIYTTRRIFDPFTHLFQVHATAILKVLQFFFLCYQDNSIKFWKCSSQSNWVLYKTIDKETKSFNPIPLFLCKILWDFNKKRKYNNISNRWKMTFQTSDLKESQFFNLLDSDDNIIEPSYIKGGVWLKFFGHSNSLCIRASRAITNHALTREYRLRFFLKEKFKYLCGLYPIESRQHILYKYKRFNEYWNL